MNTQRNRTEELRLRGKCRLNAEIPTRVLAEMKRLADEQDLSLSQLITRVLAKEIAHATRTTKS